MQSRRSGLVHTWDPPRRHFHYTFVPRHNETLEIHEMLPDPTGILDGADNKAVPLDQCPEEIRAEINMSMGHAGMQYYTLTWWERCLVNVRSWGPRLNLHRRIWIAKLDIKRNQIRIAGIGIKYFFLKLPLKLKLARNWLRLRWSDVKIAVIDALLGDRK